MKRLLIYLIGCLSFTVFVNVKSFANDHHFDQGKVDSTGPKKFAKVIVTVKDVNDNNAMDSVFVSIGAVRKYTDKQGMVEFENVMAGSMVIASQAGYYAESKKAKAVVQIHLLRKENESGIGMINNGLYKRPVEHFSGAATVVSGNDLRKISPLNFVDALKYYDPSFIVTKDNNYGDDPNATPSTKIRGSYNFPVTATIASKTTTAATGVQVNPSTGDFVASNIANPNQPVVLLNGVQVALQTALDIDINRIEKITILKDAAATSAYGVRGGTGILLIETKIPKRGTFNVTYSGQIQIATADLSSYNLMGASDKLQLEQAAGVYANNPSLYQSRLSQVNKGVNTNWLDVPTRTGIGSKNYLALDGGDDDLNYGLDFSYNDIKGSMKGSDRRNANFGGYINARIKNLSISNYLTYIKSNAANSTYGSLSDYEKQNAYWNPYDSVTGEMVRLMEKYTDPSGATVRYYNPGYNGTISTTYETAYSRLSNLTTFNWKIGYGFMLNGRFGISKQSDQQDFFLPPTHTAYAYLSPNNFFQRGEYDQTTSDFTSMEGALNLNYTKKFGMHQFYASTGVNALETNSQSTGLSLIGFTSDKLSDLAFGSAYSNSRPTTGMITTRLVSGYGNVTYSYDNRYQLEVSANADGSSQFGENNRVEPHWSAGASWNLHQERFFHANKILNQLRVRASVGTAGNQFFQSYLGKTSYNYFTDRQYVVAGSNLGTRGVGLGAYMTGFANDDLKAPLTEKQNAGFDAVLFQNRLTARFDIYRNKTTDIVLPVPSPAYTGFINYNYYDNLGAVENKGLEFDLNYAVIRNLKKGITWSLRFNAIRNDDKIVSISDYINNVNSINDSFSTGQTKPQPRYWVGNSLSAIWAVKSLGIDPATGQEKFQKRDGGETFTWNPYDKIVAGDLNPDWQGSFGTVLTVKNISAGIYFNYQFGGQFYNQTLADKIENADLTYNVDKRAANDRWKQPGDQALYKKLYINGLVSSPTYATTRFVESSDFINCSAISLDYSLPQNVIAKIKASSLKVGFIANNVFSTATKNAEKGIYYPFQHMYTFSLTAGF